MTCDDLNYLCCGKQLKKFFIRLADVMQAKHFYMSQSWFEQKKLFELLIHAKFKLDFFEAR